MNKAVMLCASMAALIVTTGCASLKPPVRPDYTGTDLIDSAKPSQLVGAWTVRNLNPFPDQPPQQTSVEYRADGTAVAVGKSQGEGTELLGDLQFEMTANWELVGDVVRHSNVEVSSSSDNAMGAMIGKMLNSSQKMAGQANIYELSANRIVMVGDDGAAMEYTRQ